MKLDALYPVGAVIYAMADIKPAALYGGTWTRIKGRCAVFVDESDADFDAAGKSGGAKGHALTAAQMPAHTHAPTFRALTATAVAGHTHTIGRYLMGWGSSVGFGATSAAGLTTAESHYHTLTYGGSISPLGSGASHENRQPYLTCYMWYRSA